MAEGDGEKPPDEAAPTPAVEGTAGASDAAAPVTGEAAGEALADSAAAAAADAPAEALAEVPAEAAAAQATGAAAADAPAEEGAAATAGEAAGETTGEGAEKPVEEGLVSAEGATETVPAEGEAQEPVEGATEAAPTSDTLPAEGGAQEPVEGATEAAPPADTSPAEGGAQEPVDGATEAAAPADTSPAEGGAQEPVEGATEAAAPADTLPTEGGAQEPVEGATEAAPPADTLPAEGGAQEPLEGATEATPPADTLPAEDGAQEPVEGAIEAAPPADALPADGAAQEPVPAAETLPAVPAEGVGTPVEEVKVPDTEVEVTSPRAQEAKEKSLDDGSLDKMVSETVTETAVQEVTDRLGENLKGVVQEFDRGLQAIPDEGIRAALQDWSSRLSSHVEELKSIVSVMAQTRERQSGDEEAEQVQRVEDAPEEAPSVTEEEVENVRSIYRQLENQRNGRPAEEPTDTWTDPDEAAKEMSELRRVRRQIRYIFGGMIQDLPDANTLRVDDLISENGDQETQPTISRPAPSLNSASKPPVLPDSAPQAPPKVPVPPAQKPEHGYRPRSGGTELSSVTNSSVVSWNSQATRDDERRRERKERKSRKHSRQRREEDTKEGRPSKKDDGSLPKRFEEAPPKQYNWAEEVVRASLDPQNQWEFPGAPAPRGNAGYAGVVNSWEQPRPRGNDVASRARERAEEVQRLERGGQNVFASPRGYR